MRAWACERVQECVCMCFVWLRKREVWGESDGERKRERLCGRRQLAPGRDWEGEGSLLTE